MVGSASAARITEADATNAARQFAGRGGHLGAQLGSEIERTARHTVSGGGAFYSVKFRDRGSVFLSESDGRIIAFTGGTNDYSSLSSGSPLRALLERDALVRANLAAAGLTFVNGSTPYYSDNTNRLAAIDDIRVAPLLKTKWSQETEAGHNCYNYYTPSNYVCGCTATAVSQVMKCFAFPNDAVTPQTVRCKVGYSKGVATNLTMQGGVYDWSAMVDDPGYDNYSDAAWSAIGKLTSDVGIALGSEYTYVYGTGAYLADAADVLTGVFGYANAVCYEDDDVYWDACDSDSDGTGYVSLDIGLHKRANRQNLIAANLDAGLPVLLGIYGYADGHVGDGWYFAGHAVVGDGYGYVTLGEEKVPYLHINLGWAGADDAWYNVPEIRTSETGALVGQSGYDFTIFECCVGNIFTNKTGEIVSGRILDTNGVAIAGAEVSAAGERCLSDDKGIYALVLPSDDIYTVTAAYNAETGSVGVVLGTTAETQIGNKWGADITLGVNIEVRTTPTNFYVSAASGVDAKGRGSVEAPFKSIGFVLANETFVAGDVIHVGPGVYAGAVVAPQTDITIIADEGPERTFLDGGGITCGYYGYSNPDCLLAGFTITNCASYGGVYGGTVSNCVIKFCTQEKGDYGGGAYYATLYDSVLHNNEAYYGGGAASSKLIHCTVYDNWAYYAGGGVDVDCIVTNSIVWRNYVGNDYAIGNWQAYNSWYGVFTPVFAGSCTYPSGFYDLGGSITNDPKCVSMDIDDWRLRAGSPCLGTALDGKNMGAWQGDGLEGFVISTSVSGRGSVSPYSVYVEPGGSATFAASGDHPFAGFSTNGVFASAEREYTWEHIAFDGEIIASFGATNYWLDAANGDDTNDGLTEEAALKSIYAMTQKAGRGDKVKVKPGVYDGCDWHVYGAEVESTDGPEATIIDGGGTNRCLRADDMIYRGFTLRNGSAPKQYGGGVYCGTLVDCIISNCTSAAGGGAAYAMMTNCLVVGNRAARYRTGRSYSGGHGGGAYECVLMNCTVADNSASYYGGGAFLHESGGAWNTIVSCNTSDSGYDYGNDVYGNAYWTMSNSLSDVNARFRNHEKGDYHLRSISPAIDAGDNAFVTIDHDLCGSNRINGVSVDMGCYEYYPEPPTPTVFMLW